MNKVSVIIPAYNCDKYIKEAVDSVLNQSYPHKEIIIIDDGSCDETHSILANYIAEKKIIYEYQNNQGKSLARNKGIAMASGEYIAFLDADDVYLEDSIEKRVSLAREHQLKMVFSDFYWAKSQKEFYNYEMGSPELKKINYIQRLGTASQVKKESWICPQIDFIRANITFLKMWTGTVMVDARYWKSEIKRFFDPLFKFGQDNEMWWHLLLQKNLGSIGFIDQPLAVYRYYNNSWTQANHRDYQFKRFWRMFEKLPDYLGKKETAKRMYEVLWAYFANHFHYRLKFYRKMIALDCTNIKYYKGLAATVLKSYR